MSVLETEIAEQPSVLKRLLEEGRSSAERIADAIRRFDPKMVLIAARGSSDNAARYAQYLFGAHNRLPVGLAAPALYTVYQAPPKMERMLVLGISQSGRSPDIVSVLAEGQRQGSLTVAITNAERSPLEKAAAHHLALRAGPEHAIAATKSYTNQLLAIAMLSVALERSADRWKSLGLVSGAVAEAVRLRPEARAAAELLAPKERLVVLGRGFNYATAVEVALKIKETSYRLAEPYSTADFQHGPIALLEPGLPVIAVAPSGKTMSDIIPVLERARAAGSPIIAISDERSLAAKGGLLLPPGTPEWLSPIVSVVPGQLLALGMAEARGLDPDTPRGLSKVTETR